MNRKLAALIAAACMALSAGAASGDAQVQPGDAPAAGDAASASAPAASELSASIEQALSSAVRADPPGGLSAPDAAQLELDGARSAYVQGDLLLYIDESGQLVSRAGGAEAVLAQGVCALTHVDEEWAYVLRREGGFAASTPAPAGDSGQGAGWDDEGAGWDDEGAGWDDPIAPSGGSAPLNGRELAEPCSWLRVALDGGQEQALLSSVNSVPVISGGYAYATQAGGLVRSDLSGASELIYSPAEGRELKLSAGPQGAICALYDQGLLVGCCAIGADGASAVHDWAANASFYDGCAASYAPGGDGSGRAGLYLITGDGERLLDEFARSDFLMLDGTLYYWHADPEQPYGFCDLMACDTAGGQVEPVSAAAQLRARLIAHQGELYLTNYDSELYALPDGAAEPEYALDLSLNYDFDSDLMPRVTLYGEPGALGALIYLDEGAGYRLIGEIAPQDTAP